MAIKKSIPRIQVEGVILEYLFTENGINCNTRIKSQLKRDINDFTDPARYLQRVLREKDALEELNTPQFQEATLAAVAELPGD